MWKPILLGYLVLFAYSLGAVLGSRARRRRAEPSPGLHDLLLIVSGITFAVGFTEVVRLFGSPWLVAPLASLIGGFVLNVLRRPQLERKLAQ